MKRSHLWIMILCCLIPLAGFAAVTLFHIPLSNVLIFGMIALCPISHLLMMKFMGDDHASMGKDTSPRHPADPARLLEEKK